MERLQLINSIVDLDDGIIIRIGQYYGDGLFVEKEQ